MRELGPTWFRQCETGEDSAAGRGLPRQALNWANSNANDNIASEAKRGIAEIEDFLARQPVRDEALALA